jgi:hypothetical protein
MTAKKKLTAALQRHVCQAPGLKAHVMIWAGSKIW